MPDLRVIVDTNAVYNRPGTLAALQPGEVPVITNTTAAELANNTASGRLKTPRFAGELDVIADVMNIDARINLRADLQELKPSQRGVFGDGAIGTTAIELDLPVITSDKTFAAVLEDRGVEVRRP